MATRDSRAAAIAATLCAGALLANQVAANATRDALFLSSFAITDLPRMMVGAAVFSVLVVLATSRLLVRFSPARFVPLAFVLSAIALAVQGVFATRAPATTAIVFYLHTIAFGSVLTSGFWSLVNERFDPRSAKQLVGRIASGGTLGAVVGGVVAERVGARASLAVMFGVLAALHLLCAYFVRGIGESTRRTTSRTTERKAKGPSGFAVLVGSRYLSGIALLVLLVTVSAALLDYVLKARASDAYSSGEDLMRFFAAYYAGLGLVSFVVQTTLSGRALDRLGLGKTAATLPIAVIVGSVVALLAPGLVAAAIARAADRVARTSLYRSAYELLYTPVPPRKKRATKSIIDVLCDRLGDAVGGAVVSIVLALVATQTERVLLVVTIGLALAATVVALRLQRGYVRALERSLVEFGPQMANDGPGPATMALARVVQRTEHLIFDREAGTFSPQEPEHLLAGVGLSQELGASRLSTLARSLAEGTAAIDPLQAYRAALVSKDPARVKKILEDTPVPEALVADVIPLLAWDEVLRAALKALTSSVDRDVELLAAALRDPAEEFAVRRRLPRALAQATTPRAAAALIDALDDPRFEVRYQAGRALARMAARIEVDEDAVLAAVRREAGRGHDVWASHRLLDDAEDEDLAARILADRASRSMEHVFRLLALVLPREPLQVAFLGLQTDDDTIRGTALEYLDSVLPEGLREELWPFLDDDAQWTPSDVASKEAIVDRLLKSRPSILVRLEKLE